MKGTQILRILTRLTKFFATAITLLCLSTPIAHALDLLKAYQLALHNDPQFQAELAIFLQNKEATPQALAALLPQVEFNGRAARETEKLVEIGGEDIDGVSNSFPTHTYSLDLNQRIFDFTAFEQLTRSKYAVKQAAMTLAAQQQELMIRVATAYFNALQAQEVMGYVKKQRDALQKQVEGVAKRLQHGHATITDLDQAKGQYELTATRFLTAEKNYYERLQALYAIIGVDHRELAKLHNSFPLIGAHPANLTAWLTKAQHQNIAVQAAQFGIAAAREEVKAQFGGHLPTLGAFARLADTQDPSTGRVLITPLHTRSATAGVDFNLPIFQGGAINSNVRIAQAEYKQADDEMMQAYRDAIENTRTSFNNIEVGLDEVKTARASVKINQRALEYTIKSYLAGVGTIIDILDQQNRLLDAELTKANVRYNFLINILLLKQAVGTLNPEDLASMNTLLTHYNNYIK